MKRRLEDRGWKLDMGQVLTAIKDASGEIEEYNHMVHSKLEKAQEKTRLRRVKMMRKQLLVLDSNWIQKCNHMVRSKLEKIQEKTRLRLFQKKKMKLKAKGWKLEKIGGVFTAIKDAPKEIEDEEIHLSWTQRYEFRTFIPSGEGDSVVSQSVPEEDVLAAMEIMEATDPALIRAEYEMEDPEPGKPAIRFIRKDSEGNITVI